MSGRLTDEVRSGTRQNAGIAMPSAPRATPRGSNRPPRKVARIGSAITIHGDLFSDEDIHVDGHVDGSIELGDHHLIIGSKGEVRGHLKARQITVAGKVEGALTAGERVEVCEAGVVDGDITTERLVVRDGAAFEGRVKMTKRPPVVDLPDSHVESIDMLMDDNEVAAVAAAASEAREKKSATPLPRVARAVSPNVVTRDPPKKTS